VAVEVGEQPLGACLGAIDGDDAEVFGSDLLDARVEGAAGVLDRVRAWGARRVWEVDMRTASRKRVRTPQFSRRTVQNCLFLDKATYQGSGSVRHDVFTEPDPFSLSFFLFAP